MTKEQALEQLLKVLTAEPELLPFLVRLSQDATGILNYIQVGGKADLNQRRRDVGGDRERYLAVLARTLLVNRLEFPDGLISSARRVAWKVAKSAAQTIATATDTELTWDAELFDTDELHDNSVSNQLVVIRRSGYYIFGANILWAANGTGLRQMQLLINNTIHYTVSTLAVSGAIGTGQNIVGISELSEADDVRIRVRQDSGGNLDITRSGNRNPTFFGHMLVELTNA